jgi:hypothetical protein
MTYEGVWWLIGYSGQLFGHGRRMTYRHKNTHTGIVSVCYDIHCISSTDASEYEIWKLIIKPMYRNIAKCAINNIYLHVLYFSLLHPPPPPPFVHDTKSVCVQAALALWRLTLLIAFVRTFLVKLIAPLGSSYERKFALQKCTWQNECLGIIEAKAKARYLLFPIVLYKTYLF